MNIPKRYKPREFAELVGVSVSTLRKWDRSGRLVAGRSALSNRLVYTDEHLVKALAIKRDSDTERRLK